MKNKRAQNFMWTFGYSGSFAVSSEGRSGGLALFWLQQYNVDLKGFNAHCIDVVVLSDGVAPWRVSFVYGKPCRDKCREFWNLLRRLHLQREGPWLVCGDFNKALCQEEHDGPNLRSEAQMELFRRCLDDCGLIDLGYSGPSFTWTNRQANDTLVRVRLDRAVANEAFSSLFDDVNVENIITTTTDHFAILIRLQSFGQNSRQIPVQSGFRFEAAWLRAPDYREMLENAWRSSCDGAATLQSTWDSLHAVASSLQKWNREVFGSVWKEISKLEYKLKKIRLQRQSADNDLAASNAERRLCEMFEREEIMAKQRSRIDWLKEGGRNTSFFHARA
jgi:hypothetical protein